MSDDTRRLLLLCHDGSWDRLYQAASAAATAASSGWRVDAVFYFGALAKLLDDRLDEFTREATGPPAAADLEAAADEVGTRAPSALFAAARSEGRCRFLACSASLRLIGRDPEEAAPPRVDEIVGWPTTLALLERADHALYL